MRAPRFSIARVLLAVVFCGVTFAALRSPSPLWANLLYSAVCVSIVLAAIQVVYCRGPARAFWTGFLIAGGSYFVVYSVPFLRESMCPRLVSEPLVDLLYDRVARAPSSPVPVTPAPGVQSRMTSFVRNSQGLTGTWAVLAAGNTPEPTVTRWTLWTEPDYTTGVGYPIGQILLASSEAFRQVGHSILILGFAVCGGFFARHRRAVSACEPSPAGSSPSV